MISQNFATIWLPHRPAWMYTISGMMLAALQGEAMCFQAVHVRQTEKLGSSNIKIIFLEQTLSIDKRNSNLNQPHGEEFATFRNLLGCFLKELKLIIQNF
jgi:hypothetical protein